MRVLLAATPASGHLTPILAVARILVDHGHDVLVTSASAFRARIEASGARFAPLPFGADMDLSDIDALFTGRKHLAPGLPQLAFDFKHLFINTIPAQFSGLDRLLQQFPAELIVADTMFGGCLPFLLGARARRPAIVGLGVTCLLTRRDDGAPVGLGLPPAADAETLARYRGIAAEVDAHLLGPARRHVDAILESLGAAPLPMPYIEALVGLHDAFLQPSVPGFDFPCMELPPKLHFIGALPVAASGALTPELTAAVADGRHLVLVTQGTVANHDLGQLIGPTLEALADRDDVIILVATGGKPVTEIPGTLPANALAAEFLPFGALMPHIDLLVTNGGYGAVTQAVSHGVPVVAAGTSEDKQDVNARIAWCGVGVDLRTETPSVEQLRQAIGTVLGDHGYRNKARALAAEFSAYDAEASILNLLERAVLEHAG
jgi:UDP:flavonoid glycosyltransferase YjiC (YdhE family)